MHYKKGNFLTYFWFYISKSFFIWWALRKISLKQFLWYVNVVYNYFIIICNYLWSFFDCLRLFLIVCGYYIKIYVYFMLVSAYLFDYLWLLIIMNNFLWLFLIILCLFLIIFVLTLLLYVSVVCINAEAGILFFEICLEN